MTDPSPWEGKTPVATVPDAIGRVTLVEGQTFCLSGRNGDIAPDLSQGLFVLDTRVLSRWELRLDGYRLESLTVTGDSPFAATFVGRGHPSEGHADAHVVVFRHRHIGRGLRERIVLTNHGLEPVTVDVDMLCDVDFADLFEVKEGRDRRAGHHAHQAEGGRLTFSHRGSRGTKDVHITSAPPVDVGSGVLSWQPTLAPGETTELCMEVRVTLGGTPIAPRFTCDDADHDAVPSLRLESWRAVLPKVVTDLPGFIEAIERCGEDLGALRIFDPEHPDIPILAAGAPWFMTVFGRDSLLTAWMTLLADPSLARGVLETLARFQGTDVVRDTEEEPGKILHEMRFGSAAGLTLGGGDVYYGSVDATPLFVMLLGELRRWDPADSLVDSLLPHADRALDWIERFGDRDGDGFVEYHRQSENGLANQGWKDSWDAIRFADGELATGPIALCEVQGYVYAAYVARAHFAAEAGDTATFDHWREKAHELRRRFNEAFWLPDRGYYALALDGDKRPVDALASNMGHCLWTGIVDVEHAGAVADHLLSPDLFSGWGIRTLARSMTAYNPVSYHNGSVWPHDNALCAAGLARYGYRAEAHAVIEAQLDVARTAGGRLPELFAGFDRADVSTPAAYPTSCSPQAWAAAAPMLWLRTLLRLDPWAPRGQMWVHPELPPAATTLAVSGIRIAGNQITITARDRAVEVTGAGSLDVMLGPRPPLTASFPAGDGQSAASG